MREIDQIECRALGKEPIEALRHSLRGSLYAYTAIDENSGKILAMMGVSPTGLVQGRGTPWFLGTDDVFLYARDLLVIGPHIIGNWLKTFRRMENIIAADNDKAIRLLRHWGATIIDEPQEHGGYTFLPFVFERAIQDRASLT